MLCRSSVLFRNEGERNFRNALCSGVYHHTIMRICYNVLSPAFSPVSVVLAFDLTCLPLTTGYSYMYLVQLEPSQDIQAPNHASRLPSYDSPFHRMQALRNATTTRQRQAWKPSRESTQ